MEGVPVTKHAYNICQILYEVAGRKKYSQKVFESGIVIFPNIKQF
jgi:hypothetical protein